MKPQRCVYVYLGCIATILFFALLQNQISSILPQQQLTLSRLLRKQNLSNLRFLAFGTSRAWGAGLKNRYEAYPFLLSENTTNLAIRAAGCEYPSLCTLSMVKDDVYDVILIEYNHVAEEKEYYQRLATKLRRRFPNATMIFLYAWSPFQYVNDQGKNPFDARLQLYPTRTEMRQMRRRLDEMWKAIASNSTWSLKEDSRNRDIIHDTANKVGGHVWELPKLEDATKNLETYGPLFLPDCTHYSTEGHVLIQQGIISILQQIQPTRDDTLGPWDSWDRCDSWFASGNTSLKTDMKMVEFSSQKFALEAPGFVEFQVDRPVMLSINYMAGGPEQIYPLTQIRVGYHMVELKPLVQTHAQEKKAIHIVQTVAIGVVEPGTMKLELLPLEENQNPFRIVGVVITSVVEADSTLPVEAKQRQMPT